jgi:hypothetical protein
MFGRLFVVFFLLLCVFSNNAAAQLTDPRLVAGQVGFGIATSFLGKLIFAHQPPGKAFKEALVEGTAWGMVAHTGYYVTGKNPDLALVGKTLAQKSTLMGRRSMRGEPVFDESLYSHWALTHSFIYVELRGKKPNVELDVVNAGFSAYYLLADNYDLDLGRTLYGGSLVFQNLNPAPRVRGFYVPGVIWIDGSRLEDQSIFAHELIHSLQAERGSTFADWHYKSFRFNLLAFANGTPALLEGWPDHGRRPHEREANLYAGRK